LAVQIVDPSIIAVAVKIDANLVIGSYLRLLFEIEEQRYRQYRDFGTFNTDLVWARRDRNDAVWPAIIKIIGMVIDKQPFVALHESAFGT
jgi:hypothetical protein